MLFSTEDDDELVFETSEDVTVAKDFETIGLKDDLLRGFYFSYSIIGYLHAFKGIFSYGFEKPSAIQKRAIRPIISGRDCICQVNHLCYYHRMFIHIL